MRTYYALWYRLNGKDSYLLWYDNGNDRDGIVVGDDGFLLTFISPEEVHECAVELGVTFVNEEPILHNLDIIQNWLKQPTFDGIICNDFNGAWNLFTDVAYSVLSQDFCDNTADIDRIYDKLFWGCNLPVFTPEGKHHTPIWTDNEVNLLREILQQGLALFVDRLPKQSV